MLNTRGVQASRIKFTSSTFMFLLDYLLSFCPFRPRKSEITEFRWRKTKCEQTCTWILVFCVVALVEGRPDAWSEGWRKAASRDCSSRKREGLYFNQHPAHWSRSLPSAESLGRPVQSNLMCWDEPNQGDQSEKFQLSGSMTRTNVQSHGLRFLLKSRNSVFFCCFF